MSSEKKVNLSAIKSDSSSKTEVEDNTPVDISNSIDSVEDNSNPTEEVENMETQPKRKKISISSIKTYTKDEEVTKSEEVSPQETTPEIKEVTKEVTIKEEEEFKNSPVSEENNIPVEAIKPEEKNISIHKPETTSPKINSQEDLEIVDLWKENLIKHTVKEELFANYHSDFSQHTEKIKETNQKQAEKDKEKLKKEEDKKKNIKSRDNKKDVTSKEVPEHIEKELSKADEEKSNKIKVYLNQQSRKKKLMLLPPLFLVLILSFSYLISIAPEGWSLWYIRASIMNILGIEQEIWAPAEAPIDIIPTQIEDENITSEDIIPEDTLPLPIEPQEVIPEYSPEEQKKENLKKSLHKLFK